MRKHLFTFFVWIVCICNIQAQYYLEYNEPEFLSIPNPPYNGYVASASWNVNNSNLSFDGHDEAGAIIYPNHYFEGSSVVTCNYRYEYYLNGRMQTGTRMVSYTVSFKSNNATLSKEELIMPVGKTEKLTYQLERSYNTSNYGKPNMKWESSKESVVTVDKNGKVTAVGPGYAFITFDPVVGPPVICNVTVVNNPPKSISLPATATTKVGENTTLTPTLTPSDAYATISWKSSDENVATVSGGKVTGKSVGKTKITATTDNNLSAECEVTIEKGTVTITADTESGLYASGKTVVLKASKSDADIYYTLDGSKPSTSSTRYTNPISLTKSVTMKAVATGENYETSDVLIRQYQITSLDVIESWPETVQQTPFYIPEVTYNKSITKYSAVDEVKLTKGSELIEGHTIVQNKVLFFVPNNELTPGSYKMIIPEKAVIDSDGEPNLNIELKLFIGEGFGAAPQKVVAKNSISYIIKEDGSLWSVANAVFSKIMDNVMQVALGNNHSLAIKKDGSLWVWGNNKYGQLGDGTYEEKTIPFKLMDDVIQVAAGDYHSLVIKKDNSLWAWGNNEYGQIGDGTNVEKMEPVKILDNALQVSAGDKQSFVIKKDNTLWGWGRNAVGYLGDGTTTNRKNPVKIMDDVVRVSGGDSHTLAIRTDGSLWAWGWNFNGQLGDGTKTSRSKPVKIMTNVKYAEASCWRNSFAIKNDGTLWGWGLNVSGKIGDGTSTDRSNPVKVMNDVLDVSSGSYHTHAIKNDHTLWAWGAKVISDEENSTATNTKTPVCVMGKTSFSHVSDISISNNHVQIALNSQCLIYPKMTPEGCCCESMEFNSSNPQIATVSSRGIVEAKAIGKTTISVIVDGKYSATCEVEVKARDIDVVISADGYATFYDSEQAFTMPSGISAQLVTGVSNSKITYQKLSGSVIPKNVPVMLINNSRRAGTYTLTASDSKEAYNGTNLLKGSDVPTTTAGNGYHYKLSYGPNGTRWNDVFGWYWGATDGGSFQIDGHKAWLVVPKTSSGGTRGYTIEGDATGIDVISSDNEGVYHDLQGRRISKPVKKGIYIRNGKIVINH